jgi:DNA-binding transcriptional ArsR family regulator
MTASTKISARDARDATIAALAAQGLPVVEIAGAIGATPSAVGKSLARTAAATLGMSVAAWFRSRNAEILAAHDAGRSIDEIRRDRGLSEKEVRRIVKDGRRAADDDEAHARRREAAATAVTRHGRTPLAPAPTRFLHRRSPIPPEIRRHNLDVLASVAERFRNATDPRRHAIDALVALWGAAPTTYAAFDVEPADPAIAAADAQAWQGGRYPRSPRVVGSFVGSQAALCIEYGETEGEISGEAAPAPRRPPSMSRHEIGRVRTMRAQGLSISAIATRLRRSDTTIKAVLRAESASTATSHGTEARS